MTRPPRTDLRRRWSVEIQIVDWVEIGIQMTRDRTRTRDTRVGSRSVSGRSRLPALGRRSPALSPRLTRSSSHGRHPPFTPEGAQVAWSHHG